MHAECSLSECKIFLGRSVCLYPSDQSVKGILIDVRRAIVAWSVRWRKSKPKASQEMFSEAQIKAIAAVVGVLVLLEEALKDNLSARQLDIVVGPPYHQNKR